MKVFTLSMSIRFLGWSQMRIEEHSDQARFFAVELVL